MTGRQAIQSLSTYATPYGRVKTARLEAASFIIIDKSISIRCLIVLQIVVVVGMGEMVVVVVVVVVVVGAE